MKLLISFFLAFLFAGLFSVSAQVSISTGNNPPDGSAMLDVQSTDKGFLLPRMTGAERDGIPNAADGLLVVCTDCGPGSEGAVSLFMAGQWYLVNEETYAPLSAAPGSWNDSRESVAQQDLEAQDPGHNGIASSINGDGRDFSYQVVIGTDGNPPEESAILEIKSTSRGFLLPRMNRDQILSIQDPASGLLAYCKDCGANGLGAVAWFNGLSWFTLGIECLPPSVPVQAVHRTSYTRIIWFWKMTAGASGYKWSTSPDYSVAVDMGSDTSVIESGLECGTAYSRYIWSYNDCGHSDSTVLTKTTNSINCYQCGLPFIDTRDGQVYNTVLIGTQCWMAQNMNIGIRINLTENQEDNVVYEKYCYDDLESNCEIYGGLYQWAETVQYLNGATNSSSWDPVPTGHVQGICLAGWHVPDTNDWSVLVNYLGGSSIAGGALKEEGTAHWIAPNTGATNTSGFTALPGGYSSIIYGFISLGSLGDFWSSTQYSSVFGIDRYLLTSNTIVWGSYWGKTIGYSVRCVRDY